jgi:hypothetical protein
LFLFFFGFNLFFFLLLFTVSTNNNQKKRKFANNGAATSSGKPTTPSNNAKKGGNNKSANGVSSHDAHGAATPPVGVPLSDAPPRLPPASDHAGRFAYWEKVRFRYLDSSIAISRRWHLLCSHSRNAQ